jgi:hypothetical protein
MLSIISTVFSVLQCDTNDLPSGERAHYAENDWGRDDQIITSLDGKKMMGVDFNNG